MSVIFLFFNTLTTVTLGFMLNGLKKALEKERQVGADLRKSEERYRIVADYNYDWEYWIDSQGGLEYISPSCKAITGYAMEAFIADSGLMTAIVHPDDKQEVAAHFSKDQTDKSGLNLTVPPPDKVGRSSIPSPADGI